MALPISAGVAKPKPSAFTLSQVRGWAKAAVGKMSTGSMRAATMATDAAVIKNLFLINITPFSAGGSMNLKSVISQSLQC
jgi:hypothetical protein